MESQEVEPLALLGIRERFHVTFGPVKLTQEVAYLPFPSRGGGSGLGLAGHLFLQVSLGGHEFGKTIPERPRFTGRGELQILHHVPNTERHLPQLRIQPHFGWAI